MRPFARRLRLLALLPLGLGAASCARPAEAAPVITVYKTPNCGCCRNWVEHLRKHGYRVEVVDQEDVTPVKRQRGVPRGLASCHTAVVEGYTLEGHVPADVVDRLLKERPKVAGLAVPGMPMGSPGMEGGVPEPYEVYTFDRSGPRSVYAAR